MKKLYRLLQGRYKKMNHQFIRYYYDNIII